MAEVSESGLARMFFTGTSDLLQANEHFVRAMISASSHCAIQASEDIFDANGLKLWAMGRPIEGRLLERLSNRKLRKPIELCVYAADPIATAGIAEAVEIIVASSPDLRAALAPGLAKVVTAMRSISPNPTELMLLSVMRHGRRDMLGHAALVTAVALTAAQLIDVHPDLVRPLARAGLLHDVGELYLPAELFEAPGLKSPKQIREIRTHAAIGERVAVELARTGPGIGRLIALSHERLDGWGYPAGLKADALSGSARALFFAEAMVPVMASGGNGLKRAAVAARLVPGEFPPEMVNWIANRAGARPLERQAGVSAEAIALDLRQAHSLLARASLLLKGPLPRETTAVCEAAAGWLEAVDVLGQELRRAGVESALSCGMDIEPENESEFIELSVLGHELLHRVRELRMRVELMQADLPDLGSSSLVIELLDVLRACEPAPERDAECGGHRVELLPWSNLYSIGVRQIDEQHRVLVGLLNRLGAEVRGAGTRDLIDETLGRLVLYVQEHFAFEEQLMRAHELASSKSHVEAHRRLFDRVSGMIGRRRQGQALELEELTAFLRQWLISHILYSDKALGEELNAKGVR